MYDHVRQQLGRARSIVPVLGTIREGRPMLIVLPSEYQTPRYNLGDVTSFEIYNA